MKNNGVYAVITLIKGEYSSVDVCSTPSLAFARLSKRIKVDIKVSDFEEYNKLLIGTVYVGSHVGYRDVEGEI